MTTSPVSDLKAPLPSTSASPASPTPKGRPSGSVTAANTKGAFASLLAKAEKAKETAASPRVSATKTSKPEALALAAQPHIQVEPQTDNRGWSLSLPAGQKTEATPKRDGSASAPDATLEDEPAKARPSAALRQGEIAFAVNFLKSAPTSVPAAHGPSTTLSSTAVPSAAPPQGIGSHTESHTGSQGGSQHGKSGSKEQFHSDSPARSDASKPGVAHTTSTPSAQAQQPAAVQNPAANTTSAPHAVNVYSSAQAPGKPAAIQSSTPAAQVAEPGQPLTTRPQSIDFRVAGTDDREVNVRVSQRSGDVQVTVRTGDADLAQSLRQHLPELSDRLAQSGVQGDIWRPPAASGSGTDGEANSSNQDATAYGGGAGENAAGQRQGNEQQQNAWLNELFSVEKGE